MNKLQNQNLSIGGKRIERINDVTYSHILWKMDYIPKFVYHYTIHPDLSKEHFKTEGFIKKTITGKRRSLKDLESDWKLIQYWRKWYDQLFIKERIEVRKQQFLERLKFA